MNDTAVKKAKPGERAVDIFNAVFDRGLILFFALIILFCFYAIYDSVMVSREAELPSEIKNFVSSSESGSETKVDFESLRKVNGDVAGWIRIDNTAIDYPIMHTTNNSYYLKHAYDKSYSIAGSIFLDMYNSPDLSDDYNVIYGHNMNERKMFGGINDFADATYFENHSHGTLFTPDNTYDLEIVAYILTDKNDTRIYDTGYLKNGHNDEVFEHVHKTAMHARVIDPSKKILILSTCHGFDGNRGVLVATYSTSE